MRNIVGNPARGDNFFSRDREVGKILISIENENNIQIAAPRRVGKTSILLHMLDVAMEGHKYVYVDTESIDSEDEFYKKLLKEIIKVPGIQGVAAKFLNAASVLARKIKSLKVMCKSCFDSSCLLTAYMNNRWTGLSKRSFPPATTIILHITTVG